MKPGDHVEKIVGYAWSGVIIASFTTTTTGEHRVVVECTVPGVEGALHIFAPEQLHVVDGRMIDEQSLCSDCPPVNYPTDETRCTPCPRRGLKQ